jgi:uncharacterized protein YndB with AHSA1/START domain
MSTTQRSSRNQTTIEADPAMPTITITREFDAPVADVFRAHVDPDLLVQWLGPRSHPMVVDQYDCRTGGSWQYHTVVDGSQVDFFGSFHEVRPDERIVQTFTFGGYPDGVSLETLTLSSGMEVGVVEGYEQLDEVLDRMS